MIKIITILLFSTFVSKAQNKLLDVLPLRNGKVIYSKVLEAQNISKDSLYLRAKKCLLSHKSKIEEISILDIKYREIRDQISFKLLWGPNDFKEYCVTISPIFHFKD